MKFSNDVEKYEIKVTKWVKTTHFFLTVLRASHIAATWRTVQDAVISHKEATLDQLEFSNRLDWEEVGVSDAAWRIKDTPLAGRPCLILFQIL